MYHAAACELNASREEASRLETRVPHPRAERHAWTPWSVVLSCHGRDFFHKPCAPSVGVPLDGEVRARATRQKNVSSEMK